MLATATIKFSPSVYRKTNVKLTPRNVKARSNGLVEGSHIIGQGITAGVIFYTSLQWAHYRRIRIEIEKATEEKESKKNEKKNSDDK